MPIKPEEIVSVLKREIEAFSTESETVEAGQVLQAGDGIARIHGLPNAMVGDLLEFPNGVKGFVLNLEEDNVGCIILGPDQGIHEGDLVKDTKKIISTPVGEALLGRVVTPSENRLTDKARSSRRIIFLSSAPRLTSSNVSRSRSRFRPVSRLSMP